MKDKNVAIIDVGSSKITAVLGERGINKTFVIKARYELDYDGFSEGLFFDEVKFKDCLLTLAKSIKKTCNFDTIYIGVPGEFTQVFVKESQISFAKKKKITLEDIDMLFEAAFVLSSTKYTLINRSAIVYELDDCRRLAYPAGQVSSILKGKLSFVVCSNYFITLVKQTLEQVGIKHVECVSSALAEALYLVDAETRDRIAILVDIGYISSTLSIIQGDGILYQKSFSYGGGYITASIAEKFEIDFGIAEKVKRKINLNHYSNTPTLDLIDGDDGQYYSINELKTLVLNSLDVLCEKLSDALESSGFIIPEYVPIMITGGGITYIRGAKEHVSSRLGSVVEVVTPKVPLMDNPLESSVLSLLELALEQIWFFFYFIWY